MNSDNKCDNGGQLIAKKLYLFVYCYSL
jgi:hypothetical protein